MEQLGGSNWTGQGTQRVSPSASYSQGSFSASRSGSFGPLSSRWPSTGSGQLLWGDTCVGDHWCSPLFSPLPRGASVAEVHLGPCCKGELLVAGKALSLIPGDGSHELSGHGPCGSSHFSLNPFGTVTIWKIEQQEELADAPKGCQQHSFPLASYEITLPLSQENSVLYLWWTFRDHHHVSDRST